MSKTSAGNMVQGSYVTLADIERTHVDRAIQEADELGRSRFLERYGFGHATAYVVRHDGHFYDPKALVGAAHSFTDAGETLTASEFDATRAISKLRAMGFEVLPFAGLWWVNQGATYRQERDGGYVWAPKLTKAGRPAAHHVAVSELRPNQRIIHYAMGAIRAIGRVVAPPQSVRKPDELTGDAWDVDGYGCRVSYQELGNPIPREQVPNRSSALGPFDRNGDVKQGYLYRVADEGVFPLLEFLNEKIPDLFTDTELPPVDPFQQSLPNAALDRDPLHDLLVATKNVVLEGVPGTGKSYAIERLAREWVARTGRELLAFEGKRFAAVVMHPSSSYEDFIEGLRPASDRSEHGPIFFDEPVKTSGHFVVDDGFFLRICARAAKHPERDVLVLIDELNRCNVSSVLGDLLLTLEASRRGTYTEHDGRASAQYWQTAVQVRLPYSGRLFFVPNNVYVVATTNTTDRSVAPLDAAIRRRFAFYRIEPDLDGPISRAKELLDQTLASLVTSSAWMIRRLNAGVLAPCIGPDGMLGPSYVYALIDQIQGHGGGAAAVARMWRFHVLPQLVDVTRSFGAEDLLSKDTRELWFGEHGSELAEVAEIAHAALTELDTFLGGLGIRVIVDGTGLSRGARIVDATSPRVDVMTASAVAIEPELDLFSG